VLCSMSSCHRPQLMIFVCFKIVHTPKMVRLGDDEVVDVESNCDMLNAIFFNYHSWPAVIDLCECADSILFQCPSMCVQLVEQSSAAMAGANAGATATGGDVGNNIRTSEVADTTSTLVGSGGANLWKYRLGRCSDNYISIFSKRNMVSLTSEKPAEYVCAVSTTI